MELWQVPLLPCSVTELLHQNASCIRQYIESLEGGVHFGSNGLLIVEFLQREDACLHQQTYSVVDYLHVQIRVTCYAMNLLALFIL
jgi:hypothetical protein